MIANGVLGRGLVGWPECRVGSSIDCGRPHLSSRADPGHLLDLAVRWATQRRSRTVPRRLHPPAARLPADPQALDRDAVCPAGHSHPQRPAARSPCRVCASGRSVHGSRSDPTGPPFSIRRPTSARAFRLPSTQQQECSPGSEHVRDRPSPNALRGTIRARVSRSPRPDRAAGGRSCPRPGDCVRQPRARNRSRSSGRSPCRWTGAARPCRRKLRLRTR